MSEIMLSEDINRSLSRCLRSRNEDRIHPRTPGRIEVVFLVEATNYLLLRTEGAGYETTETLPESGKQVPVIMPQKLHAVMRRRLLQHLREYRNKKPEVIMNYVRKASNLGFKKAKAFMEEWKKLEKEYGKEWYKKPELADKIWNCTIQPPLAEGGEKSTDLGMDGFCPHCTIFGGAYTQNEIEILGQKKKKVSLGEHSRVHPDPAFALRPGILTATHNKVTEGFLSITGGALYDEVHVLPGTIFIGRLEIAEPTFNELLAILYSLVSVTEIGGRANIYGTVRMYLLGIRCGRRGATTALWLADELVENGKQSKKDAISELQSKLKELGFKQISNEMVIQAVENNYDSFFDELWKDALVYSEQVVNWIRSLR